MVEAATDEIGSLADRYIQSGVLTGKLRGDAEHIAAATVAGASVLASWSFRHMVNVGRIQRYNELDRKTGHAPHRHPEPEGA